MDTIARFDAIATAVARAARPWVVPVWDAPAAVFGRALDTLLKWQERARQRHALRELDDHLLKDVGISRADVEREAGKPFWRP
ncbi:MAG: DUF1127 domain-containing protein [Acidiferrobacterales bacterium]